MRVGFYFIFILFFLGCQAQESFRYIPNANFEKEDVYKAQELDLAVNDIKRESGLDLLTFPSSDEVNEFIEDQVNAPNIDCNPTVQAFALPERDFDFYEEDLNEVNKSLDGDFLRLKLLENFKKLGGDPVAFEQTMCFFDKYSDANFYKRVGGEKSGNTGIRNKDYVVIQDLTMPSSRKRFFMLNMKTGEVDVRFSAHGMGTAAGPNNNALNAEEFSNDKGSNLTPRGFMVTGERQDSGFAWEWHMKFDGLQVGLNDNSRDRAIVFHKGVPSNDGSKRTVWEGISSSRESEPRLYQTSADGQREYRNWAQGMSWGCTTVAKEYAEEVYEKTKGGALYYNYTKHEKELGENYCGGENLLLRK